MLVQVPSLSKPCNYLLMSYRQDRHQSTGSYIQVGGKKNAALYVNQESCAFMSRALAPETA